MALLVFSLFWNWQFSWYWGGIGNISVDGLFCTVQLKDEKKQMLRICHEEFFEGFYN
jgi:hypothetical protein